MVDRIQRDAASRVLRSFIDGAITNDEFEAQFPRSEEDSALPAIKANVWMLYSDLHRHKLTGKHEPNAETRALLERCVLFLETNLEFEWPVPKIGLSNILPNLWLQAKARLGGSPSRETPQSREGDEDVWPSSEGGTTMRASLPRQDADETGTPPSGVGWTVCIALLVLLGAGLLTRITDDAGVPISCCPRYPRLAYKMMQQSGRRAVLDGSSS